ncbi:hypothetical protein PHYSODRAFT_339277 [Phytophthora sojae]|uniref:Uncharacterized protein n=1 Tax=Phytophthora sojae (strain P6497) TaxID=1094619 RepID=G5A6A1_PHYSP|nr:hypothetical protein PHYSODRAFT_339277 [Phytophthora sojae]EGZ08856.1 hypothetical protein PHYSODRAFT_339277 [Phytophthora sojae]|eukprot:XP_009535489.1 hypothetical protein PHYSODRAFT_339277 [Phytophthora sojae]
MALPPLHPGWQSELLDMELEDTAAGHGTPAAAAAEPVSMLSMSPEPVDVHPAEGESQVCGAHRGHRGAQARVPVRRSEVAATASPLTSSSDGDKALRVVAYDAVYGDDRRGQDEWSMRTPSP